MPSTISVTIAGDADLQFSISHESNDEAAVRTFGGVEGDYQGSLDVADLRSLRVFCDEAIKRLVYG